MRALAPGAVGRQQAGEVGTDADRPSARGLLLCRAPRLLALLFERTPRPRSVAGRLIPQPTLDLDEVLGLGFALVSRQPTPSLQDLASRWRAREVVAPPAVAEWMRRGGATAVLVRPDRYVLAASNRRGRTAVRFWG